MAIDFRYLVLEDATKANFDIQPYDQKFVFMQDVGYFGYNSFADEKYYFLNTDSDKDLLTPINNFTVQGNTGLGLAVGETPLDRLHVHSGTGEGGSKLRLSYIDSGAVTSGISIYKNIIEVGYLSRIDTTGILTFGKFDSYTFKNKLNNVDTFKISNTGDIQVGGACNFTDTTTQVYKDGSANLTFKDANAGTVALSALSAFVAMDKWSGFVADDFSTDIVNTYDSTTRKITLTGTFTAYYKGALITELISGWVSDAIPDVAPTATWFLKYNGGGFTWSTTPWNFSEVQIAYVCYKADGTFCFSQRETHGTGSWEWHRADHYTRGTYRKVDGGGELSDWVAGDYTERYPDVAEEKVWDEDLPSKLPVLSTKLYTQMYLSGTGTPDLSTDQPELIEDNGSDQPYYNEWTGSLWQKTLVPNNSYYVIWKISIAVTADTTSQKSRFVFMAGQEVGTLFTMQGLSPSDVTLGDFSALSPEFVFTEKVICKYTSGQWHIVETERLTGTRALQVSSPSGSYLTQVQSDTTLVGSGVSGDELGVNPDLELDSLGIGIPVPDYILHVKKTTGSCSIGIDSGDADKDKWVITSSATGGQAILQIADVDNVGNVLTLNGDTGYVGINDSTPQYRLDVNGTFRAVGAATLNNSLSLSTTAVDAVINLQSDANSLFSLNADTDGKLYLGSSNPVTILNTGYVGINESTPDESLHVNGNIRIETTNYHYYGDAATDGSWRTGLDSGDFVLEKRESGSWITKGTFS